MKKTREQYVFIKTPHGEQPDVYVAKEKFFEDALFNFVYNTLGYSMIKVEADEDIKADYV